MKLTSLISQEPMLTVTLHNGSELQVRPKRLSPPVTEAMNADIPENESIASLLARHLAVIIEEWDVVDDAGAPVPVTEELLRQVHWPDLRDIHSAILRHFFPTASASTESVSDSADGSPQAEN